MILDYLMWKYYYAAFKYDTTLMKIVAALNTHKMVTDETANRFVKTYIEVSLQNHMTAMNHKVRYRLKRSLRRKSK